MYDYNVNLQVCKNVRLLAKRDNVFIGNVETGVHISKGTISRIESGAKNGISIETCCDIANYFDVPVEYLIGKEVEIDMKKDKINELAKEIEKLRGEIGE